MEHMDEPRERLLATLPLLCTDIRDASEALDEADESGGGEPARATGVGVAARGGARNSSSTSARAPARGRFLGVASFAGDCGGAHSSGVSKINPIGNTQAALRFWKLTAGWRALAAVPFVTLTSRAFLVHVEGGCKMRTCICEGGVAAAAPRVLGAWRCARRGHLIGPSRQCPHGTPLAFNKNGWSCRRCWRLVRPRPAPQPAAWRQTRCRCTSIRARAGRPPAAW